MTCKFASYPNYTPHIGRSISLLPEGWVFKKLGYLSSDGENAFVDGPFGSDLKSSEYTDFGTPLIQLNNIKVGSHCLINLKFIPEDKRNQLRRHIARAGDIIIAKMADPVARAAIVSDKYDEYVIVADCVKLTLNEALIDPKYAIYAINSKGVNADAVQASTGTTRIRINLSELKKLSVPYPPLVLQRTIAAFLDYETARLDSLIDKQQRLIELLKEKRQAVISHAVTKGLNPNAPMKDSGVEWLGQVPEHWVVQKLGYLCKVTKLTGFEYTNYWSPDDLGDVVALRGYNIGERKLELEKGTERISTALSNRLARSKLNAGDLVLPCTGTLGNAAVIPTSNTYHINQNIAKLTFDVTVLPEYASYWLTSSNFRRMVDHNNTSGMQPVLLIGDIRNMRIPIPPVEEQQTLVDCLNKDMARFELVVSKALFSLTLLEERRTALISAAVTGEIDLRGWRPPVRDAVA